MKSVEQWSGGADGEKQGEYSLINLAVSTGKLAGVAKDGTTADHLECLDMICFPESAPSRLRENLRTGCRQFRGAQNLIGLDVKHLHRSTRLATLSSATDVQSRN